MNLLGRALRITRNLRFRLAASYVIFFALPIVILCLFFRQTLSSIFDSQVAETLREEFGVAKSYIKTTDHGPDWFYDHDDPDESYTVEQLRHVYMLADSQGHPLQWSELYRSIGYDKPDEIRAVLKSNQQSTSIRKDAQGIPYMV